MTNPDNVGGLPELPELPEPRLRPYKQLDTVYYNAGQMKEYARAYGELCRAAPAGGEYEHRWNEDGERCVKCGDKDWMGGPSCSRPDSAPAGSGAVEELELLVIDLLACEGCDDPHNDSALGNLHAYIRRRGLGDALHEATHYPEDYQRKAAQTETIGGILDDDPTG